MKTHDCLPLEPLPAEPFEQPELAELRESIVTARERGCPLIVFMGAHPVILGLSRFLIDLSGRGFITHLATNGAGIIREVND